MIILTIRAVDKYELMDYMNEIKKLIKEGYTSGTLLDGWDITEEE